MTLDDACDEILSSGILQHEYGIPVLWPRTAPQVQKPDLEKEYYDLNKELALKVNRLVFLNKMAELRQLDPHSIEEQYKETFEDETYQHMSFAEKERHLRGMTRFKTEDLTGDFLTVALPVLRSIHQENSALTDAEFTILNNLKKLYSHYNEHPANIRRLLAEYNKQKDVTSEELEIQDKIEKILAELAPNLAELESCNNEYVTLRNSYENKLQARDTDFSEPALKRLKQAAQTLSRRLSRLSSLCDFIPNFVLCQATNWYTDKSLLAVVDECQSLAEKLEFFPNSQDLKSIEGVMKADLAGLSL
ncbi:hypothetical protein OXX59_004825 [Metschnikowia pulcherrima]